MLAMGWRLGSHPQLRTTVVSDRINVVEHTVSRVKIRLIDIDVIEIEKLQFSERLCTLTKQLTGTDQNLQLCRRAPRSNVRLRLISSCLLSVIGQFCETSFAYGERFAEMPRRCRDGPSRQHSAILTTMAQRLSGSIRHL
jgi:hypothetical protein